MRVVQLGPWPPPFGGVQTHLVALRQRLTAAGVPNQVINITGAPESGDEGVHYPRSGPALLRLLATLPADIVHLHLGGHLSARLLALCALCNLLPRRQSVLTFHSGGYPSSPAGRTASPRSLRGVVLQRFDRIIVVNRELEELFLRFGCRAERLRVIRPHPHPDVQVIERRELPPLLKSFMARHARNYVSVGLLEEEYDIQLQIAALPTLRNVLGDAGLMIIGSGSLENALRSLISASPVSDHILLAGDVGHDDTLAAIRAADALLRTTRYDGDSISVREGLALGTPVIATDTGMRPAGCHLFRIGSADGLVQAVTDGLAAPAQMPGPDATHDDLAEVLAVYRELAS